MSMALDADVCARCGLVFASYVAQTPNGVQADATPGALPPQHSLAQGRYTVQRKLSQGGMGALYLATDHGAFDRTVVIKQMLKDSDPADQHAMQSAHERFIREGKILASLKHPNIPQIFTFFEEDSGKYIVMEHVQGHDLAQHLSRVDPSSGAVIIGDAYPPEQVARWGIEVCRILKYLAELLPHALVHGDIKPANLVLCQGSDELFLLDFGAGIRSVAGGGVQQHSAYGTPGYAPPEQYEGYSEPRSDVYALAATLYHLATDDDPGQYSFTFPKLDQIGALGEALRSALAHDVAQRPTAAEFRARLEDALAALTTQPLIAPDGSAIRDTHALAQWRAAHRRDGIEWLMTTLPSQVERFWRNVQLTQSMNALAGLGVGRDIKLDLMLAHLNPQQFGALVPQLNVNRPIIDFGQSYTGEPRYPAVRFTNTSQRPINADITVSAHWITTPSAKLELEAGQSKNVTFTVDPPFLQSLARLDEVIQVSCEGYTLAELRIQAN
jgi:tRNA A-37 threonylcarbamoyl transferase component Bud32